jgi:uncharacterized membrane protein
MMHWHSPEQERKETGRIEALSDGVFAIAVTLLVLGIPVPGRDSLEPGKSLQAYIFGDYRGLAFLTYGISFLTILVMWINHHSVFQFVARIDRPFVIENGLLLMFVTFVNYPTALVANFAGTPDATFATALYSAVLIVISVLYNLLWFRIINHGRLLVSNADSTDVDTITRQYRFGWAYYLAAFALAFVNPWLSIALNAGLAIYFAFTGRITRADVRYEHRMYTRKVR